VGQSKEHNHCPKTVQPVVIDEEYRCKTHSQCNKDHYCSTYNYCWPCSELEKVGFAQPGHSCHVAENEGTTVFNGGMNIRFKGNVEFVKNDFKDEVFDISDNIYAYTDLNIAAEAENKNRTFVINEDTNIKVDGDINFDRNIFRDETFDISHLIVAPTSYTGNWTTAEPLLKSEV